MSERENYDARVGRIARGAGMSTFGQGFGRVLAIVTQIVLARMYGPAQLGFYVLGTTVVAIADIVAEFGMNRTVVRYVAQYRADEDVPRLRGVILLALGVTFALGWALSVLIFLGAGFLANEVFDKPPLEAVFRAIAVGVPFFTLMSMALYATEGFQTVKYSSIVKGMWQPLVNIVLVVALYPLGTRVVGAAAAYAVSMIVGSALALYYLRRLFPELFDRETPPIFERRATFNVSGQVWVSQLAEYTNVWVAVTVLGIYASGEAVGIYNAAARTAWISGVVFMAFSGIFSPMIAALYRGGHLLDLSNLYKDVSRWIFGTGLAVFLLTLLLAKDILAVFGEAFIAGWLVMIVVAAGQLFSLSIGATNRILVMTDYQKIYMWAMIGGLVTNLTLSFTLIPIYGMMGAAWATMGSIVLPNAITLVTIRRVMGLWPYTRQHLKVLGAGLSAAALAFAVRELFSVSVGLSAIFLLTPLLVAGYAAMLLILGLSRSDRQFLKSLWIAIRRVR